MNKPAVAMPKAEMMPLATIKPYWRNPRKNDAAVPGVKESIQRYGMNQPIVVDSKNVIIVGHTRYRAMIELGLEEAPVIVAKHLTAKQAKEFRIADNKTSERASWDRSALMEELRGTNLDTMALFFDEPDLAKLLTESNGSVFQPVTGEQLDKILDKQKSGFEDLVARPQVGNQIKLTCPHCLEDFHVDRSIIEEHEGEK